MTWKAYYHQLPANDDARDEEEDLHSDLRIRSRKYPLDYHHPLFEEIKKKIMRNEEDNKHQPHQTQVELNRC